MQFELAFLERTTAPVAMKCPWDQIDPQAQICRATIRVRVSVNQDETRRRCRSVGKA
jgi:hypothetical protein